MVAVQTGPHTMLSHSFGLWVPLLMFANSLFAMEGDSERLCQVEGGRGIEFSTIDYATINNVDISPDGSRIVFDHLGDIYIVPVVGGTAKVLAKGGGWNLRPVWSPDGSRVAFISNRTGVDQVFVVGVEEAGDGRKVTDLKYTGADAFNPVINAAEWSPDSTAVIVDGYRINVDNGRANSIEDGRTIDVLDAGHLNGGVAFQGNGTDFFYFKPAFSNALGAVVTEVWELPPGADVVEKSADVITHPLLGRDAPLISVNRQWLVYRDRSPVEDISIPEFKPLDGETHVDTIRVRNRHTGDVRILLGPGMSPGWRSNGNDAAFAMTGRFAISPDSKHLIAAYGGKIHKVGLETVANSPIPVRINVEKCLDPMIYNEVKVDDGPFAVKNMRSISLRPDGRQLAFSALRRLYVMDIPSGEPGLIAPQAAGQFQPNYSPDGKWIAFVSWDETKGGHVWRVPAAGGTAEQLTEIPAYYQTPVWSPDGERIAFIGRDDYSTTGSGFSHYVYGGSLRIISVKNRTVTDLSIPARLGHPPAFSADGLRVFYAPYQEGVGLQLDIHSVALDGSGHRAAGLGGLLPAGGPVSAMPSPDGKLVAIIKYGDLYLISCASPIGSEGFRPRSCTQGRVTHTGAYDPRWRADGAELEWSFANSYYRADIHSLLERLKLDGERVVDGELAAAAKDPMALRIDLVNPRHVGRGQMFLRGARIITMRGDEVIENGIVHIRDGRIVQVDQAEHVDIPKDATVMSLVGKTIVPGFIDAHAHISELSRDLLDANSEEASIYLAFGVTTARDPSNGGDHAYTYTELIEAGEMIAPRLFGTEALIPANQSIEELGDALGIARRTRELGGTFLKIHDGWDRRQSRWIIEAAKAEGLNVAAHFRAPNYVPGRLDLSTVIDGVTTAEHGFSEDKDLLPDVVSFLMMSGVALNLSTLSVQSGYPDVYFDGIKDDERIRRFFSGRVPKAHNLFLNGAADVGRLPRLARSVEDSGRMIADIAGAGGNVMIGSHGNYDGVGFHWEMWAHVSAGMTKHEVLRAATINGARGIGLEKDLGSIEIGKIADLLILDGNPLDDIRNSISIHGVMKSGVLRDARTLYEIWPERRQFQERESATASSSIN